MSLDTSTLLELVIDEDGSDRASMVWSSTGPVASVALIAVEARAALAAAKRAGRLTAKQRVRPSPCLPALDSMSTIRRPTATEVDRQQMSTICGTARHQPCP